MPDIEPGVMPKFDWEAAECAMAAAKHSAQRAMECRDTYGSDSVEHLDKWLGTLGDCVEVLREEIEAHHKASADYWERERT